MREPNGKTLGVLHNHEHLYQLYLAYCQHPTAADGHRKFHKKYIPTISTLQRIVAEETGVVEVGPKQAAGACVAFYLGGQAMQRRSLMAHEYLDVLASIAERIPGECWNMLDSMAATLLREHTSTHEAVAAK